MSAEEAAGLFAFTVCAAGAFLTGGLGAGGAVLLTAGLGADFFTVVVLFSVNPLTLGGVKAFGLTLVVFLPILTSGG